MKPSSPRTQPTAVAQNQSGTHQDTKPINPQKFVCEASLDFEMAVTDATYSLYFLSAVLGDMAWDPSKHDGSALDLAMGELKGLAAIQKMIADRLKQHTPWLEETEDEKAKQAFGKVVFAGEVAK